MHGYVKLRLRQAVAIAPRSVVYSAAGAAPAACLGCSIAANQLRRATLTTMRTAYYIATGS